MIVVVVLGSGRVKLFVAFFVIGLLKENICADPGIVKLAVVFNGRCGDIDVHPADRAVFVLDRVNGINTFQNVLDRIVDRILAGFDRQTLVTHILQGDDLCLYLFLRQLFSADMLILSVIGTVNAAVHAVI